IGRRRVLEHRQHGARRRHLDPAPVSRAAGYAGMTTRTGDGTTLTGLLALHLGRGPGRPLLATPEATCSSADLEIASSRVAAWLRERGLRPGDRVVIDLPNGLDAVAALFGVARVGGIAVGASPAWTPRQLTRVIRDAGAHILITGDTRVARLDREERPP